MSKTIVILQSNYIPWKGYFDLMAGADEFILYDEVQFTKNDWRNRNRIVLNQKLHWLTIAVRTSGAFGEPINAVTVSRPDWGRSHWETIRQAYRRAPGFAAVAPVLEEAYDLASSLTRLTEINELFLRRIAGLLRLDCVLLRAERVPRTTDDPTGRLVEICLARGATRYLSGPAGRAYLRADLFADAGIELCFADYSGYPIYEQDMPVFEHGVSILDGLMRCGSEAVRAQLKSVEVRGSLIAPH